MSFIFVLACNNKNVQTVMVNNSTHISTKRTITSHLISLNIQKRPRHVTLLIQVLT